MPESSIKAKVPNSLSVIRFLLASTIVVLCFIPHPMWLVQTVFIAGVVTDKLDGTLARTWGVVSELGKKLESVVDPFFASVATVYMLVFLGFPLVIFWIATGMTIVPLLGRVYIKVKTGKLFYEKSQLTRYGVGLIYVLIVLYLFSVPYREVVAWVALAYGVVIMGNYLRMQVNFMKREQSLALAGGVQDRK